MPRRWHHRHRNKTFSNLPRTRWRYEFHANYNKFANRRLCLNFQSNARLAMNSKRTDTSIYVDTQTILLFAFCVLFLYSNEQPFHVFFVSILLVDKNRFTATTFSMSSLHCLWGHIDIVESIKNFRHMIHNVAFVVCYQCQEQHLLCAATAHTRRQSIKCEFQMLEQGSLKCVFFSPISRTNTRMQLNLEKWNAPIWRVR